jgi:hypothetical protein
VSLGQLVPGARTADPYRVDWAEQDRGDGLPFGFEEM